MAQKTQAVDRSRTAPRRISKRMARLLMFGVLFLAATAILMTVLPDSAPTVQPFNATQGEPEQQVETASTEEKSPLTQDTQPQQESIGEGETSPALIPLEDPGIPFITVSWQVKPQNMLLPPTEGGFYDGSVFTNPETMGGVAFHDEDAAYVISILPWLGEHRNYLDHILRATPTGEHGILAAIAKDPESGAVFIATHFGADGELVPLSERERNTDMAYEGEFSRYFVSVDGENSWYEISNILVGAPCSPKCTGRTFSNTRIKLENSIVHLFLMDSGLPSTWYYVTLEFSNLPR